MSSTGSAASFIILLFVARNITKADERLAQDSCAALALGEVGRNYGGGNRASSLRFGRKLILTPMRCAVNGGRRLIIGDDAEGGESRLALFECKMAAEAEHELGPELFLVGKKLSKSLQ